MRAFNSKQTEALLNAFGEPLEINGVSFKAILEVRQITIEDSDGVSIEYEYYFTAKKNPVLQVGTLIEINNATQIIYNLDDDLSGVVNYYYRRKDYDSWS
ncbi:hypothetical protein [Serratia marcescens]|uniref:hypothetical protein n=1 Tax=Serratia marcescens TaxID=615 RepID=UPI000F846C18|nr:hypothetical protein [Serratia marcescens]